MFSVLTREICRGLQTVLNIQTLVLLFMFNSFAYKVCSMIYLQCMQLSHTMRSDTLFPINTELLMKLFSSLTKYHTSVHLLSSLLTSSG